MDTRFLGTDVDLRADGTAVGERAIVGIQSPITIREHSEVRPDVFPARPRTDDCTEAHPRPDEVLLLIEAADTSVAHDRDVKLPLYAEAGTAEVWLVELNTRTVDVGREPVGSIHGGSGGRSPTTSSRHSPSRTSRSAWPPFSGREIALAHSLSCSCSRPVRCSPDGIT